MMGKMKKFEDYNYSLLPHVAMLIEHRGDHPDEYFIDGNVATRHCLVDCYSQDNLTRLWIARDGKMYCRRWWYSFGKKTIVNLAKQFADDIYGGNS